MNNNTNGENNVNSCGPLDHGYGLTPSTTTNSAPVNMTPFQAPSNSNGQQASGTGKGHRRSSIGNFFDTVVGVDSSHQIPMRKTVSSHAALNNRNNNVRRRSSIAKFLLPDTEPNSAHLGRRRSSAFTSLGFKTDAGGDEHKGQAEYMDRLREAEKNLHLTHNKDGLPLPKDNNLLAGGRRRSSLAHILGLDKPLLAR
ncbi:hypothetical protein BGZ95_008758 [Linnemannia exigua]|uniref:Uncharacterized protein n=1 Tax=Linnemannia exigua TaxID=604196 RepID=A0AAD4DDQ1_9FUNG|nr:hypothetical protein BGZ95_008758 [Linnemannia exigua]